LVLNDPKRIKKIKIVHEQEALGEVPLIIVTKGSEGMKRIWRHTLYLVKGYFL